MKTILNQYVTIIFTLLFIFIGCVFYTFNERVDLNGDNCYYYMYAKSIAYNNTFSDLSAPGQPLTNNFPPGYPLLMSPFFWISDSIVLQNFLGELFLLGSALIVLILLIKTNVNKYIALFVSALIILNEYLLKIATATMSELPFAFFTLLTVYALSREKKGTLFYTSKFFWAAIFFATYTFHIRTQGIVLLLAVVIHYLFRKDWIKSVISILSFITLCLPWIIRNKSLGLGSSRYLNQILLANVWDPEKGNITLTELITRSFDYLGTLLDSALPESIMPFLNNGLEETSGYKLLGVIIVAISIYGCWKIKSIRYLLISFILGSFALVCVWSSNSPSGNRYLICFLPLLILSFYYGLATIIKEFLLKKAEKNWNWITLTIILVFLSFKALEPLHEQNKAGYPINYENFISLCQYVKDNIPEKTIFCVRKPELFYMFSNRQSVKYLFSTDTKKVIKDLVDEKVDYVILDQLGYSSTPKFLYPAIQKYASLFSLLYTTAEPQFYLLKFDKEKAALVN